jgi:hypothetical protein
MPSKPNALRWDGKPGHYEVYYLTLTDPVTGVGFWIRYTMLAPLPSVGEDASCALWFLAMDPRGGRPATFGRKATFPIGALEAKADPFELKLNDATLTDQGMRGAFGNVAWDLRWAAPARAYEHVHPAIQRIGAAQTVLTLPGADLSIDGTISFGGEQLALAGARGGQAHLWGHKHARRWAWAHCSDFTTAAGEPVDDAFIDGVSVFVRRLNRDVGPSTPVVARIDGQDFRSTSPLRVLTNDSTFSLTGWRFEAVDGRRKLVCEIEADRARIAGVTYHDPDGELAYCYNGETASMRLALCERARQLRGSWSPRATLVASGRVHFEYAQRTPVPELELLTT